jgi:hypothetical protein
MAIVQVKWLRYTGYTPQDRSGYATWGTTIG